MPTQMVIGMGERNGNLRLKENKIYTLFAKDVVQEVETGEPPGHNTYSSQPVYMCQEKSGMFHLVYIRNTNPIDFLLH